MKKLLLSLALICSINAYASPVDNVYIDFITTRGGIFNLLGPQGDFDSLNNKTLISANITRKMNQRHNTPLGEFGTLTVFPIDKKGAKCEKNCVGFIIQEIVPKEHCEKFVTLFNNERSNLPILLNKQEINTKNNICSFKEKTFTLQYIHFR